MPVSRHFIGAAFPSRDLETYAASFFKVIGRRRSPGFAIPAIRVSKWK